MTVKVTARGAERWKQGHPWIYRSDVAEEPDKKPGIVPVTDRKGKFLGQALYSPSSEIRLRLLTRGAEVIDPTWWAERIAAAARRRNGIEATAWRAVHAEGDGLPSFIVDRYGPWVVAQLLSAGLESARPDVLAGIQDALAPDGILLRNDAAVRRQRRDVAPFDEHLPAVGLHQSDDRRDDEPGTGRVGRHGAANVWRRSGAASVRKRRRSTPPGTS